MSTWGRLREKICFSNSRSWTFHKHCRCLKLKDRFPKKFCQMTIAYANIAKIMSSNFLLFWNIAKCFRNVCVNANSCSDISWNCFFLSDCFIFVLFWLIFLLLLLLCMCYGVYWLVGSVQCFMLSCLICCSIYCMMCMWNCVLWQFSVSAYFVRTWSACSNPWRHIRNNLVYTHNRGFATPKEIRSSVSLTSCCW